MEGLDLLKRVFVWEDGSLQGYAELPPAGRQPTGRAVEFVTGVWYS
jgi:hypothetical protein